MLPNPVSKMLDPLVIPGAKLCLWKEKKSQKGQGIVRKSTKRGQQIAEKLYENPEKSQQENERNLNFSYLLK